MVILTVTVMSKALSGLNKMSNYIIDTHSHIDMQDFKDFDEVILNATNAGVKKIIVPSVDRNSFSKVLDLAQKHENIYCALGIHPSEVQKADEEDYNQILRLGEDKKVVAIGECGLDYYWDKTFIDQQKVAFAKQIEIANNLNKPLIVHNRDAHKDTFDILTENIMGIDVIMHCFSGSYEFAKECINKGFYIGIGGVVTFKNAKKIHEIAKNIPLEYILLETDAPYLTPVPFRGKRNEPAYTKLIAEEIAKIRDIPFNTVVKVTTENAGKVFKI